MAALAERGSVVFVARSSGLINYLYVNWLVRRLGLPPLRVAVNFVGLFGWLAAVWRSVRALVDAAARGQSTAVIFLNTHEESGPPFEALVELQRGQQRPIFLVPLILVWNRRAQRVVPSIWDLVWGSPESPTTLPAAVAFLRNYKRAFLRVGRPIDLAAFVAERPEEADALVARKARGTIHHHLARELRASVGPPLRTPTRVTEKVMRDRHLREVLGHVAKQRGRSTVLGPAGGGPRPRRDRQPLLPPLHRLHPPHLPLDLPDDVRPGGDRREGARRDPEAGGRQAAGAHAQPQEPRRLHAALLGLLRARPHPAPGRGRHQPGVLALRLPRPARRRLLHPPHRSRATRSTARPCAPT